MRELVTRQNLYHYRGPEDSQAHCMLRIFRDSEDETLHTVMLTEVVDNPGISTSNHFPTIAAQVCRQYGLDPKKTTFVDHHGRLDTYELVEMKPGFRDPQWLLLNPEIMKLYSSGKAIVQKVFA